MKLTKEGEEQSLAFGGQALIEGVMFRSRRHLVMCVRQPDHGILMHSEQITPVSDRYRFLGLPFLRGMASLFETLYLGFKALYFSANAILDEEEQLTYKEFALAVVMALALASFFFTVPFFLATLLNLTGILFNIVEALLRLTFFVLYLFLVSMWGNFQRILRYHGAEHKAINAYEAGIELNVLNVQRFSRYHSRCGNSFIFIVLLVSAVLFSIMPSFGFISNLTYRLLLIPVIAAVSYELLKLSDRYRHSRLTRILTLPGLAFQRLMTKEPDQDITEVAVKAVKEIDRLSKA